MRRPTCAAVVFVPSRPPGMRRRSTRGGSGGGGRYRVMPASRLVGRPLEQERLLREIPGDEAQHLGEVPVVVLLPTRQVLDPETPFGSRARNLSRLAARAN